MAHRKRIIVVGGSVTGPKAAAKGQRAGLYQER